MALARGDEVGRLHRVVLGVDVGALPTRAVPRDVVGPRRVAQLLVERGLRREDGRAAPAPAHVGTASDPPRAVHRTARAPTPPPPRPAAREVPGSRRTTDHRARRDDRRTGDGGSGTDAPPPPRFDASVPDEGPVGAAVALVPAHRAPGPSPAAVADRGTAARSRQGPSASTTVADPGAPRQQVASSRNFRRPDQHPACRPSRTRRPDAGAGCETIGPAHGDAEGPQPREGGRQ